MKESVIQVTMHLCLVTGNPAVSLGLGRPRLKEDRLTDVH